MNYNNKITVQERSNTVNDIGGQTTEWSNKYTNVPCRINWKKGVEKVYLNRDDWLRDMVIYCSVHYTITPDERVVYDGQNYNIQDVENPDEMNRYQKITLKEEK